MPLDHLLHRLADGEPISGEVLASELGVTRAAIWKQVSKLSDYGLRVEAQRGRGYRLSRPINFLDARAIEEAIGAKDLSSLARLEVFRELDSTNDHLLGEPVPDVGRMVVCLAEHQRAGRGRHGRQWNAPLGGGLCLSLGWQFAQMPDGLSALSLAIGVAARRALGRLIGADIGLKWPNDLVYDERKLGGILVDLRAEAHGGCFVVVGLGINVSIPTDLLRELCDWPRGAIDLAAITDVDLPSRSRVAAELIQEVAAVMRRFAADGFASFEQDWRRADVLADRSVCLRDAEGERYGVARGIDADGALLLETEDGHLRRIIAADVNLRPAR